MQFQTTALALVAGASIVSAGPVTSKRAGAPIAKPIPGTCSVYDSEPSGCTYDCAGPGNKHYKPTDNTVKNTLLYQYQLGMTDYQVTSKTPDQLFEKCLETCYGYGYSTECHGVYQSFNVPTDYSPVYICQMFTTYLTENNFNAVENTTTYDGSRYGNIYCPATTY